MSLEFIEQDFDKPHPGTRNDGLQKSLIAEAKLLVERHPSKDCRHFAKSVLDYLESRPEPGEDWDEENAIDMDSLDLAILFHREYEKLAPGFGYDTKKETRIFDPKSPNGKLMVAVCEKMLEHIQHFTTSAKVAKFQQRIKLLEDTNKRANEALGAMADEMKEMASVKVEIRWPENMKNAIEQVLRDKIMIIQEHHHSYYGNPQELIDLLVNACFAEFKRLNPDAGEGKT